MAWTKAKTAVVVGVAAFLMIGTGTVVIKAAKHSSSSPSPYEKYFQTVEPAMSAEKVAGAVATLDDAPPALVLRSTRYEDVGDYVISGSEVIPDQKIMRRGCSIEEVLSTAYEVSPGQMILPSKLPAGRFDLLLTLPAGSRKALQAEIKKQFGLAAHTDTRNTRVLVLKSINRAAPGLKASNSRQPNHWLSRGNIKLEGYQMSVSDGEDFAHLLGSLFKMPVIDETRLTNTYDLDLGWAVKDNDGGATRKEFEKALHDQLGLTLTPGWHQVEMLVVEKVK